MSEIQEAGPFEVQNKKKRKRGKRGKKKRKKRKRGKRGKTAVHRVSQRLTVTLSPCCFFQDMHTHHTPHTCIVHPKTQHAWMNKGGQAYPMRYVCSVVRTPRVCEKF